MPKFDLCRYVEVRYDKRIEAATEREAEQIAKSLPEDQWGDPEATTSDEIVIFNTTGDEVGRV